MCVELFSDSLAIPVKMISILFAFIKPNFWSSAVREVLFAIFCYISNRRDDVTQFLISFV